MKRFFLILLALVFVLPVVEAKIDANQLIGGLLNAIHEPQTQAPAQSPQKQDAGDFGDSMTRMARVASAPLIDTFKEEGRAYAREVGDIITERILDSRKISDTLDSMRIFCWAVILYLTVVTLVVIYMLLRLRVLYARIMAELKQR